MYFLKPDTTMKKIVYAGLALGLMTVVSCQKELTEGQMENTVAQITKTMYVEGNEWIPEADTRTAYEPGVGIDWTGNETFAIYYGDPDKAATATTEDKYMNKATDVTALGSGKYSFKHDDLGIEAYNYSVIVPDITTTRLQGSGLSATFKLSPVQTPGANTYDPNYDILFGQGAFGVAPAEELEITKFKRVTAPLRLSLSDGAGVIGDEKIHAATISFSQAAAGQNGFAGTVQKKCRESPVPGILRIIFQELTGTVQPYIISSIGSQLHHLLPKIEIVIPAAVACLRSIEHHHPVL